MVGWEAGRARPRRTGGVMPTRRDYVVGSGNYAALCACPTRAIGCAADASSPTASRSSAIEPRDITNPNIELQSTDTTTHPPRINRTAVRLITSLHLPQVPSASAATPYFCNCRPQLNPRHETADLILSRLTTSMFAIVQNQGHARDTEQPEHLCKNASKSRPVLQHHDRRTDRPCQSGDTRIKGRVKLTSPALPEIRNLLSPLPIRIAG